MGPRIGSLFEIEIVDATQPALLTWKDFYGFRNQVIRVLRDFGSAGPMGEVDLSYDDEDSPVFKHDHVRHPDFFVVDDMYNGHDRLSLVECDVHLVTAGLLKALAALTDDFAGWCVNFSLGDSGLRIGLGAILVGGRRFWEVESLDAIAERCAHPVDYGIAPDLTEEEYHFWRGIIGGTLDQAFAPSEDGDRQWREALRTLEDVARRRRAKQITRFDYAQVRHDLHPQTRGQLLRRLFNEFPRFTVSFLNEALLNIQTDAGHALQTANSHVEREEWIDLLSAAQESIRYKLPPSSIILWWAHVLYAAEEPKNELKRVLISKLWSLTQHSDEQVQLSAIFGLARLRVEGLASLVADFTRMYPEPSSNPRMREWLEQLSKGSRAFPDGRIFEVTGTAH